VDPRAWTAPLIAVVAVYAVGCGLDMAGADPWQVAWVSVAATACAAVAALLHAWPVTRVVHAAVSAAGGGAWLVYVSVATPWTSQAVTYLAVLAVVLGPLWPVLAAVEQRREARRLEQDHEMDDEAEHGEWPRLLARLGVKGLRLVEEWTTEAGTTVELQLPANGKVKFRRIEELEEGIEIACGLWRGAVRVEEGATADRVLIHAAEVDVLAETFPLPEDDEATGADDPFPIGVHEDYEECLFSTQRHAKIVGITESGKSNLLNVLIKRLLQCPHRLVVVIDPKGGRMAAPWLKPWLDGRTDQPVLLWVATTEAEWTLVLQALVAIMDARSAARIGGEKVIASELVSQIAVIIDEIADVTANYSNKERVKRLVRKGASEQIRLILAGQRGTVTMFGDGDLKSQIGATIGLGVSKVSDAQTVFPDDHRVARSLARMVHPGSMYVQDGPRARALPAKAYRIEYDDIPDLAARFTAIRPVLDELSARAAAPYGYADRWSAERAGHLRDGHSPAPAGEAPAPQAPAGPMTTAERLGLPPSRLIPLPPGMRAARRQAEEERTFDELVRGLVPMPPILAAVAAVFERLNVDQLHTARLLEELPGGLTARRLSMLLAPLGVAPGEEPFDVDGKRARGYQRADVEAAVERVRSGEIDPPREVFGWPPEP
jgi:S-DNA-T family DNA segregation ATPase FtsK/SpoIIIE